MTTLQCLILTSIIASFVIYTAFMNSVYHEVWFDRWTRVIFIGAATVLLLVYLYLAIPVFFIRM